MGSKHTLTPPTYFQGSQDPSTLCIRSCLLHGVFVLTDDSCVELFYNYPAGRWTAGWLVPRGRSTLSLGCWRRHRFRTYHRRSAISAWGTPNLSVHTAADSILMHYAMVTTVIRLRFDGRSTAAVL